MKYDDSIILNTEIGFSFYINNEFEKISNYCVSTQNTDPSASLSKQKTATTRLLEDAHHFNQRTCDFLLCRQWINRLNNFCLPITNRSFLHLQSYATYSLLRKKLSASSRGNTGLAQRQHWNRMVMKVRPCCRHVIVLRKGCTPITWKCQLFHQLTNSS